MSLSSFSLHGKNATIFMCIYQHVCFIDTAIRSASFIRFAAMPPFCVHRCGHCQELAPTWEELADVWVDDNLGLVGEVDCSTEKVLCRSIQALPTLKHGDPFGQGSFLTEYNGDKDLKSLSQFAKATLVSLVCGPSNLDACEDVMKGRLMYFMSMGEGELEGAIQDQQGHVESIIHQFDHDFTVMQAEYNVKATDNESFKARIRSTIKMIKSVQEYRKLGDAVTSKDDEL
jgi:hypothetical protein